MEFNLKSVLPTTQGKKLKQRLIELIKIYDWNIKVLPCAGQLAFLFHDP